MKTDFLKRLHVKEAWVIFFILGIIMMNYPFIHIFDKPDVLALGMPLLFFYLYGGWFVSTVVIYMFVQAINLRGDNGGKGETDTRERG
jgi:hypothetical protein